MRKKVFAVEFNQYSDCLKSTVSDGKYLSSAKYVHLPNYGSLLIFEDQIEFYKQFGQGFKQLTYVGELDLNVSNTMDNVFNSIDKVIDMLTKLDGDITAELIDNAADELINVRETLHSLDDKL